MTTERQIAANRANAKKSTGPRTKAGKAAASRNNARHGLYSATPVIPRLESPEAWEQHCTNTIYSLAPANPVEEALAERVALILWRLDRVARYEHHVTTRAQQQANDDVAAEYDEDRVEKIRAHFVATRQRLRAFDRFRQRLPDDPIIGKDADIVIVLVAQQVPDFDMRAFAVPGILGADDRIVDVPGWTVARIQQLIDAIAEATGRSFDDLIQAATAAARARHNQARVNYRAIAREVGDLRRERVLPQNTSLDNVIRYEAHLNRQLNQALAQLERLQHARRASQRRPPDYRDYHVPIDPDTAFPSHQAHQESGPDVDQESISSHSNPIEAPAPPSQTPDPDGTSTSQFTPWQARYHA